MGPTRSASQADREKGWRYVSVVLFRFTCLGFRFFGDELSFLDGWLGQTEVRRVRCKNPSMCREWKTLSSEQIEDIDAVQCLAAAPLVQMKQDTLAR
jgi:hypothetical protein